jgi:hypothetical protein
LWHSFIEIVSFQKSPFRNSEDLKKVKMRKRNSIHFKGLKRLKNEKRNKTNKSPTLFANTLPKSYEATLKPKTLSKSLQSQRTVKNYTKKIKNATYSRQDNDTEMLLCEGYYLCQYVKPTDNYRNHPQTM